MNFEEWKNPIWHHYETDIARRAWNAALEEAAKLSKEPLDNPTEEEIAQMAQSMTIGEIKANRIRKL